MEDQLVKRETFGLAVSKGLWATACCWRYDEEKFEDYLTITQTNLQKWLREEHKIHIGIILCHDGQRFSYFLDFLSKKEWDGVDNDNEYETYEDCLEAAIIESLEYI